MDRVTIWVILLIAVPLVLFITPLFDSGAYRGEVNPVAIAEPNAKFKVLFLGNSFTEFNDLPENFEKLLETGRFSDDVLTRRHSQGGYTLEMHLRDATHTETPSRLRLLLLPDAQGLPYWDLIVVQAQSQTPGLPDEHAEKKRMLEAARKLAPILKKASRDVVLLMTWGYREADTFNPQRFPDFRTMQDHIEAGYYQLADTMREAGLRNLQVAPVGLAFERLRRVEKLRGDDPDAPDSLFWKLYRQDGSHPSPFGTYLAAATLYGTYTRQPVANVLWAPMGMKEVDRNDLARAADYVLFKTIDPAREKYWFAR